MTTDREEMTPQKRTRRKTIRKTISRRGRGGPGLVIVSSHKTAAPRKRQITKRTY